MKVPDCFYYKLRSGKKKYTDNPPGDPDISRMIAGKPCWASPVSLSDEKQKSLVLANWTGRWWSKEKIEHVKNAVAALMEQGFTLYLWQNGRVVPIDKRLLATLNDDDVQNKITLAPTQDVINAAVTQNKLTLDQVQVLDDYWINQILSQKQELAPRVLRTSEIEYLSSEEINLLITIIKTTTPKLEKIIHDKFSKQSNNLARLLKMEFSGIPIEDDYKMVTLNNLDEQLISHRIVMDEFEINLDGKQWGKLQSLVASGQNSLGTIESILKVTPNLKTLTIYKSNGLSDPLTLDKTSLQQLESLSLHACDISLTNLETILKAAPKLKSIHLTGCNLRGLTLEKDSLLQLESIDVSRNNITLDDMKTIMKAAPNLNQQSKNKIRQLIIEASKQPARLPGVPNPAPYGNTGFKQPPQPRATPINPKHDPSAMRDFKPPSAKAPFEFKGTNRTYDQAMIIEKLCQYLTLENKHIESIPKLQGGICNALSHYFLTLDSTDEEWDTFITMAQAWTGVSAPDARLKQYFDALYADVDTYQLHPRPKTQYIGDGLESFLTVSTEPCVLSNPWHAIAIKPTKNGDWMVYDPNYVTGRHIVTKQELLNTIHDSIGTIISVESDRAMHPLQISNPDEFISHGGLLALCSCDNAADMLSQLLKEHTYSKDALDGLLLRGTSGRPAWVRGLASTNPAIQSLTQALKNQFELLNTNATKQLANSMDALTPLQKHECITNVIQSSTNSDQPDALIAAIRAAANQAHYEKALTTWDKTSERVPSALVYCQQCLSSDKTKRLIELDSTQQVDTLRVQFQELAASTQRPVFYIDKPDDLVCSAPWLKKNPDNTATLCKGPGGPLYEFLQANKDLNPLLIVNYEHFDADDMVRFNGLLDSSPKADGTDLPPKTMIIGVMNRNKPDCYQGSDFYSRFNCTELCPLTPVQLDALKFDRRVEVTSETNPNCTSINLYHAPDWKERLLGRWGLNGDTLTFSEGELAHAIQAGKPIEIQNGFWGEPAFERFWQQAMTLGVRHGDRVVQIPDNIQLVRPETDAYVWASIPTVGTALTSHPTSSVLNPTCLASFFGSYELEGKTLVKKPGLIEQAKASTLSVNVTRTLNDDSWAMLLDECKHHKVQLTIDCAPGVELPTVFHHQPTDLVSTRTTLDPADKPGDVGGRLNDRLIISTDMDTSVSMLTKETAEYVVIDVSECTPSDLLLKLDGKLNPTSLRFEFSQSDGALTTALADNKKVILKGHFSPELLDALAPVMQRREQTQAGGQLMLVTDDTTAGAFVSHRLRHDVTVDDKLACLPFDTKIKDKLTVHLETEPLSKLMARGHYLASHSDATHSDDAWLGMNSLAGKTQASTAMLDKASSAQACIAFTEACIKNVNEVLKTEPYVFLTGLSGVGKSTFVENELCTDNDTLYLTEDRIQHWAEDTSDKRKILFLDEANLSSRQWSEFEGLFNTPPSLLVNGKLHALSPHHKVVFAGNPVNYGDERTLAPLFQRHGNAVLFTPLPPAVIYEKILKPVFENTDLEPDVIAERILEVYRFVCDCSTTEILITPRELQMMALLTLTQAKQYPQQDIPSIAEHFSYELAKNLVPAAKRAAFDTQFSPKNPLVLALPTAEKDSPFLVTPSRQALSQQLNDLLGLRHWRRNNESDLNTPQKGGGLGGIIIEGEPGIGKSELVMAELRARNYTEERDLQNPTTMENPFYKLHVTMTLDEKETLLMKAFKEGAVVMIDEINSSPMMERLLNDLLMGKNPKGNKDDIVKPGFMVIGTQNPVTMAGRRVASTALQRRLITTVLPEYKPDEIKTILLAKGIKPIEADAMIVAYEANRAHAIKNTLSPVPNFRHLIMIADDHLRSLSTTPGMAELEMLTRQQNLLDDLLMNSNLDKSFTETPINTIDTFNTYKTRFNQTMAQGKTKDGYLDDDQNTPQKH